MSPFGNDMIELTGLAIGRMAERRALFSFNGAPATDVVIVSDHAVRVKAPAGLVGDVDIVVEVNGKMTHRFPGLLRFTEDEIGLASPAPLLGEPGRAVRRIQTRPTNTQPEVATDLVVRSSLGEQIVTDADLTIRDHATRQLRGTPVSELALGAGHNAEMEHVTLVNGNGQELTLSASEATSAVIRRNKRGEFRARTLDGRGLQDVRTLTVH